MKNLKNMEFRFEDILKNIIPGALLLTSLIFAIVAPLPITTVEAFLKSDIKEYSEILLVSFLVVSYLFGYLIDAISSWAEHYLIHKTFGSPSYNLLTGKGER